ncbi:biotin-dependent carboxyltransferase family protein [Kyrpidia spormannii]|uniref:Allophanate hydrolase n=1 Tax=Kyrpidia spormannii TaxID=2055160 RepID=A0ACA8Z6C5_9BACL|nr:biotin-dependent carboxyltransferase family protein [Kyrpidia spormannii]CAB3390275.1 Allophanate hydrolase [Kyrpidia spormannii]
MIRVVKPGLSTTVQDLGRPGYYSIGLPPSGALDKYSHTVANLLVGNDPAAATLEVTYLGPELEFRADLRFAVCGADMPAFLNGQPIPLWTAVAARSGDVLSFGMLQKGARSYIAVEGGIGVPPVMGSRSTYALCGIGGHEGRALKAGDMLEKGDLQTRAPREGVAVPEKWRPNFAGAAELHVVPGLYVHRLTEESKQEFFAAEWTVTPEANRVGYRYKGIRLQFVDRPQPFGAGSNPSNVVDCGYPIGSIQVPDGVEPIVLLNDAVTGGGYATIGTVISADLDRIAQTRTNQKAKFVEIDLAEALRRRRERQTRILEVESFLRQS